MEAKEEDKVRGRKRKEEEGRKEGRKGGTDGGRMENEESRRGFMTLFPWSRYLL